MLTGILAGIVSGGSQNPTNNGVDPNRETNTEATGFVMVGCVDCFFDL